MSLDTRTSVLNGLAPKYAEIFGETYSNLYREHIGERVLVPCEHVVVWLTFPLPSWTKARP